MTSNVTIPKTIRQHKYSGLYGRIWQEVHRNEGIVTMIFCGKRGKGKSLSMMEVGRILDRGEDDVGRFKPEHVRLDPVDFFTDLTGKYPTGKVICLDDAGLHMYKSDALSDILKRVSKVLQNIRYKQPIILMSVPYFGQIMLDARSMTDIFIEMRKVDRKKKVAIGSMQTLKTSAFTGDLYRYNILQADIQTQPKFSLKIVHWKPTPYEFNKPPDDFIKAYNAIKNPTLDKINQAHLNAIKENRDDELGKTRAIIEQLPEAVEFVRKHINEVIDSEGIIVTAKIMMLKDENGNQKYGQDRARQIKDVIEK